MTQTIASKKSLYESDLNLWLETAIAQLKSGKLQDLDIENLIEELEGLAGRDRRELKNRLRTLLEHLLKRMYVVDMPQEFNGWERTIREQRHQIESIIEQSPSLKNIWDQTFAGAWRYALQDIRADYAQSQFPDSWQFDNSIDTILTIDFWELNGN
jgi:hypothetical protein